MRGYKRRLCSVLVMFWTSLGPPTGPTSTFSTRRILPRTRVDRAPSGPCVRSSFWAARFGEPLVLVHKGFCKLWLVRREVMDRNAANGRMDLGAEGART